MANIVRYKHPDDWQMDFDSAEETILQVTIDPEPKDIQAVAEALCWELEPIDEEEQHFCFNARMWADEAFAETLATKGTSEMMIRVNGQVYIIQAEEF